MRSKLETNSCDCSRGSTARAVGLLGILLVVGSVLVGAAPAMAGVVLTETGDVCGDDNNFGSCTAGDVNITFIDATPIDEEQACDGPDDTIQVTFTVGMENNSNANRHDPAYYVALDGGSAEVGDMCLHGALDLGNDIDGDSCIDLFPSGTTEVTTTQVTLKCSDPDGNGSLGPINVCSSAKTPGAQDTVCDNVSEAFANPGSKCECGDVELETDIVVPPADPCKGFPCDPAEECNINVCENQGGVAVCVPQPVLDDSPCGDSSSSDCDNPDTCFDGECQDNFESTTTECQDGDVCTSTDGVEGGGDNCDGAGQCVGDDIRCDDDGNDCTIDSCVEGFCNTNEQDDSPCGDPSSSDCDNPDTCFDGECQDNFESTTTECQDGDVCTSTDGVEGGGDNCDGAGQCVGDDITCDDDGNDCSIDSCVEGFCNTNEQNDTPCGDPSSGDCDNPDTCVDGDCQDNFEPTTTGCEDGDVCTSTDGVEGGGDNCDGAGQCVGDHITCDDDSNDCTIDSCVSGFCNTNEEDDTPCGDSSETDCDNPDTCEAGECQDNFEPTTTDCEDGDVCTSTDGVEGGGDNCDGAGECVGDDITCDDDSNDCTIDSCVEGFCNTNEDPGTDCDDGSACTDTDVCDGSGNCFGADTPATLTVVKDVQNDDGNGLEAMDFTLGLTVNDGDATFFPGSSTGETFTVDQGDTYTVSENLTDQPPIGDISEFYNPPSFVGDCDTTTACDPETGDGLAPTCTVVNDDADLQNQRSITVDQNAWTYDLDGLVVTDIHGSFHLDNVSSLQPSDVVVTNLSVELRIREDAKGKFELIDPGGYTCTFIDPAPFVFTTGQDVTFWCEDIGSLDIDAGDVVKATVFVEIFQGHKIFKNTFSQQIQ